MITETTQSDTKDATVGAQAAVAPEKTPSKNTFASQQEFRNWPPRAPRPLLAAKFGRAFS